MGPLLTHMLPLSLLSAGSGAAGHVRGREREERARSLPASPRRRSLRALLRRDRLARTCPGQRYRPAAITLHCFCIDCT